MLVIIFFIILSIFFIDMPMLSFLELRIAPDFLIKLISPDNWQYLRLFNVFTIYALISFLAFKKYNGGKNSILFLCTTPWIYIVAHEFNPIVAVFLTLLSISILFKQKQKISLFFVSLLIIYLLIINGVPNLRDLYSKLHNLLQLLNLTSLFAQMEPITSYLRVPRNGYLSLSFLIILIFSLLKFDKYSIKIIKQYKYQLLFSVIFFFLYPSDHLIFSGSGILLLLSSYLIYSISKIKSMKYVYALLFLSIIQFPFFIESYSRQYMMRYSTERSEPKFNLFKEIVQNHNIDFYLPTDNELKDLKKYYSYHKDVSNIFYFEDIKNLNNNINEFCKPEKIKCVFDDKTLEEYKLDKNNDKYEYIKLKNSLNFYYIL